MNLKRYQNAVRILFILVKGSVTSPGLSEGESLFAGEARLHAFDFWMRYPDYFAAELLDLYAKTNDKRYLIEAESIFNNSEPDLRRYPMIRFHFGAYERIDETLSILASLGLVKVETKRVAGKTRETNFIVTPRGKEVASEIEGESPALGWYSERATLVAHVADNRGGGALKDQQYERPEYATTALKGVIPPITEQVLARLQQLKIGV